MPEDRRKAVERILSAAIDPNASNQEARRRELLKGLTQDEETVQLLHRSIDGGTPIDFVDESIGTVTWFNLIGLMLDALRHRPNDLYRRVRCKSCHLCLWLKH